MRTVTYAVYDRASGEVVHLHVEPVGLDTSPEEVLQLAAMPRKGEFRVMKVPDDLPVTGSLRVENNELHSTREQTNSGAAGIHSPFDESFGARVYDKEQRSKDE